MECPKFGPFLGQKIAIFGLKLPFWPIYPKRYYKLPFLFGIETFRHTQPILVKIPTIVNFAEKCSHKQNQTDSDTFDPTNDVIIFDVTSY